MHTHKRIRRKKYTSNIALARDKVSLGFTVFRYMRLAHANHRYTDTHILICLFRIHSIAKLSEIERLG